MHNRGGVLSPLGTRVLGFQRGEGGGTIKTVFSVTSLPLLSNIKSANTKVTMEAGKSWANI